MKKITLSIIGAITLLACGNGEEAVSTVALTNEIDSVSYAIGAGQAKGLLAQVPELNVDAFLSGYKDVADSATLMISDEDSKVILTAYGAKMQEKQMAKQQEEMAKMRQEQEATYGSVKEEGLKFLEENKANAGVQVTESGLQYIVLKKGNGKTPTAESNVKIHYHGTTPDGTVFDSSVEKGAPIDYPVNGFIKGWIEGLQLMKEGAKYKFFIPQELAYGVDAPQGGQGPIKPFMPLVFEVELIKIND